ncbi:MAG: hypothetical protein MJ180_05020 [Candidatus Gastranaerophilales bacterium]|nr:hypothetical protein [Candidatus Gastranaerophilales bacterium]
MLKKFFILSSAILLLGITMYITEVNADTKTEEIQLSQEKVQTNDTVLSDYKKVSPLDLVANPNKYMNKKIKMTGKFDKFTAIGLDYPPVNRDAKNHISFMIKRGNVTTYNIPLSELKLILKRDYAEKELIDIETGDDIEIYGNVFSVALGDPWVDVDKVIILTPKKNKKDANKQPVNNSENKDENESNKGK